MTLKTFIPPSSFCRSFSSPFPKWAAAAEGIVPLFLSESGQNALKRFQDTHFSISLISPGKEKKGNTIFLLF